MTGKLSKNFHGVGIGPLSNILAVMVFRLRSVFSEEDETFQSKILIPQTSSDLNDLQKPK